MSQANPRRMCFVLELIARPKRRHLFAPVTLTFTRWPRYMNWLSEWMPGALSSSCLMRLHERLTQLSTRTRTAPIHGTIWDQWLTYHLSWVWQASRRTCHERKIYKSKTDFQSNVPVACVYSVTLLWPWPLTYDDLDTVTWPIHSEDVPANQKWSFWVKALKS